MAHQADHHAPVQGLRIPGPATGGLGQEGFPVAEEEGLFTHKGVSGLKGVMQEAQAAKRARLRRIRAAMSSSGGGKRKVSPVIR